MGKIVKIFIVLTMLLFVFLLILLFSYLSIAFVYKREKNKDHGFIYFSLFKGFIHYSIEITEINFKGIEEGIEIETELGTEKSDSRISVETIKKARERYHQFIERISHLRENVHWFLNKVICEKLIWSTRLGTGDAMETGVVAGMAWGIVSTVVGFFGRYINWRSVPQLEVVPDFQRMNIETHIHIIIRFRVGNAIRGIYRLLIDMRKKKEDPQWLNTLSKA